MKIRYNRYIVFLGFIWLLYEQFFYLMPDSIGGFLFSDIANCLLLVFSAFVIIKEGLLHPRAWDIMHKLGCCLIMLTVIAVFMADIHWHQSIMTSFFPQRSLIVIAFSYFAIEILLKHERIKTDEIYHMLMTLGKIYLLVFMAQFILLYGAGLQFMTCEIKMSMELPRFYVDGSILLLVLFHEITKMLNDRICFSSLLWIAMEAVYFFLMCQTRMILIGIICAIGIYFLTWKTTKKRKLIACAILTVAMILVWNTSLFQDTINMSGSSRDTSGIRINGILFYLEQLTKSPVFGYGYPNSSLADAQRGRNIGYMLNDNGVFGFAYIYGALGVFWIIVLYFTLIAKSWKLNKSEQYSSTFMMSCYFAAVSSTLIHWYWVRSTTFLLILLCAIIERASKEPEHYLNLEQTI